MLEMYLEAPFTLERYRSSPVGPHIDGFAAVLFERGYAWKTGGDFLRRAVHLGGWAGRNGIPIETIDETTIGEFEAHLPSCDCPNEHAGSHVRSGAKVQVFLEYLRQIGVVPPRPIPPRPPLLVEFEEWLRCHRGSAEATIRAYGSVVSKLLDRLGEDPGGFTPQALRSAMVALAAGHGNATADQVVTATRMFLRFLAVLGRCDLFMVDAILPIAPGYQAKLPNYLTEEEVDRMLAHCDTSTPDGLRDRAILLLFVRLGLRAGDVRSLRFQDIDWADATFRVIGKGRRETRLPLPQDVGDAILAYLERGRPHAPFEEVFLTTRPPWGPCNCNLTPLVTRALRRAGIDAHPHGTHLLRHTAATAMLNDGVSLPGISAVLRHRSMETTAQYARVDMRLLRQVAQPWPEVSPC